MVKIGKKISDYIWIKAGYAYLKNAKKKKKFMNLDSSDTNSKYIDGTFNPLTCSYGMYVKKMEGI